MNSVRFWSLLLVVSLLGSACHRPTAEDRDNRRLLEQILTAVTLTNSRLLEDAAKRGKQRHDAGQIADDDFQALEAIINKGARRTGLVPWQTATPSAKRGRSLERANEATGHLVETSKV